MSETHAPRRPLDDIRALLADLPGPDQAAEAAVRAREASLIKPVGSLGRLEETVAWLARWQGKARPTVDRPLVAVFAASHGVAAHGVSPYPPAFTAEMVAAIGAGGAAINQLCGTFDLGLKVFDLALDIPTADISREAALAEVECAATMAYGMEATAGGIDLLCLGGMGAGNTTIAAALCHALYGGTAADWVGRGRGLDDAGLARKIAVVEAAVALHRPQAADALDLLCRLGGREVAAIAGAILAARAGRIPVVVDGYVATAAAAILHAMRPGAIDHCLFAHVPAEAGHGAVLARLGQRPLLDLGLSLGEGTGAALAAGMVRAAARTHAGMATFAEGGISRLDLPVD